MPLESREFPYGPYRVRLWLDILKGRPSIVGVEIWGIEPQIKVWDDITIRGNARSLQDDIFSFSPSGISFAPTAITAKAARLPLGRLLDDWLKGKQALGRAAMAVGADPEKVQELLKDFDRPKPGRPPHRPELLRLIGEWYQQAESAGDRAPAKAVHRQLAKFLKRRDLKASTVRSWIKAARDRGHFDTDKGEVQ